MSDLIVLDKVKARHFHSTNRFIDDLCTLNDGGEFGRVYKDIYPSELELKVEHSGSHATCLNLDIDMREGIFVYNMSPATFQRVFFTQQWLENSYALQDLLYFSMISFLKRVN